MKNILKKSFCTIIAVASVFCIISCGNMENTPISTGASATTKDPFNISGGTSSHSSPNGEGHGYAASYDYLSFEENLENVNTIVKAKLVSIMPFGTERTKFTFSVNEVLLGEAEETIDVIVLSMRGYVPAPYGKTAHFYEDGVMMESDCEYLLLLVRGEDVYSKVCPRYAWQRGMIINLDDVTQSEMYNEPLSWHAKGININTCTKEELIDYVCELTKGNVQENVISKAKTLEEIVDDAEKIIHIKLKELKSKADTDIKNTEIWLCEVKETLKGELSSEISEIEVVFFADTVEAGEEYIVAVEGIDSDVFYRFITKDSLRPLSEKAEIKGYID